VIISLSGNLFATLGSVSGNEFYGCFVSKDNPGMHLGMKVSD